MNTIESSIMELGLISQMVYGDLKENKEIGVTDTFKDDKGHNVKLNNTYKVIDYVDNDDTDMQALLLERGEANNNGDFKGSGNYVLAFRGTESRVDIEVDAIIGLGNINIQYSYALEFTYKALAKIAKDKNCSIEEAKSHLTLTGHSLGGILTQQVGANLHIEGYAYNPYGVDRLLSLPPNYPGISDMFLSIALYKIMKAVGLTKVHANWAYEHISTISYQDEGAINGDILSNWATNISSAHLGKFIPIFGKNLGLDAHFIASLNYAISEYNDILKHFNSNVTYKELTNAYLATAIVHQGKGYETLQNEFKKLGVFEAADNSLNLQALSQNSPISEIFPNSSIPISALYSLVHLNPFIVSGVDSPVYKELEKYKDEYSDDYIEDKAKMLKKALISKAVSGEYYKDYQSNIELKPLFDESRQITDSPNNQFIFGTNKNDDIENIKSKLNPDTHTKIYALAGDDNIKIVGGSAYIEAGSGNDTIDLRSSKGENTVYGGVNNGKDSDNDGDDTIYAGQEKDTIYGGNDTLYGNEGNDILEGGSGNDRKAI